MHLNPSDTNLIGETIIKLAADYLPEGGDVAILSASSTATNQNAWIEAAKKVLPEKFPKINLVATVYGDDDSAKSTDEAKGLLEVLSEPQGDHRADHRRHRCRRAGRHRRGPDRQDQRHRPGAAVGVQEVHRQRRLARRSRSGTRSTSAIRPSISPMTSRRRRTRPSRARSSRSAASARSRSTTPTRPRWRRRSSSTSPTSKSSPRSIDPGAILDRRGGVDAPPRLSTDGLCWALITDHGHDSPTQLDAPHAAAGHGAAC